MKLETYLNGRFVNESACDLVCFMNCILWRHQKMFEKRYARLSFVWGLWKTLIFLSIRKHPFLAELEVLEWSRLWSWRLIGHFFFCSNDRLRAFFVPFITFLFPPPQFFARIFSSPISSPMFLRQLPSADAANGLSPPCFHHFYLFRNTLFILYFKLIILITSKLK